MRGPDWGVTVVDDDVTVVLDGEDIVRMPIGPGRPERLADAVVDDEVAVVLEDALKAAVRSVRRPAGKCILIIVDEIAVVLKDELRLEVRGVVLLANTKEPWAGAGVNPKSGGNA